MAEAIASMAPKVTDLNRSSLTLSLHPSRRTRREARQTPSVHTPGRRSPGADEMEDSLQKALRKTREIN
jgi:hypothetical protein